METIDRVGFIIIPPTVLADKRLSANAKLVYGRVFGFIERYGYCDAPNEYLATHMGMSKNTFRNNLSFLYELGYLHYELIKDERGELISRRIYPRMTPPVPRAVQGSTAGDHSPHTGSGTDIKKNGERKNNVQKKKRSQEEIEYYAELLADKLSDHKSITFYKIACQSYDPQRLLQKAAEIISDGGARNPAAVFTHWLRADKDTR